MGSFDGRRPLGTRWGWPAGGCAGLAVGSGHPESVYGHQPRDIFTFQRWAGMEGNVWVLLWVTSKIEFSTPLECHCATISSDIFVTFVFKKSFFHLVTLLSVWTSFLNKTRLKGRLHLNVPCGRLMTSSELPSLWPKAHLAGSGELAPPLREGLGEDLGLGLSAKESGGGRISIRIRRKVWGKRGGNGRQIG